jgi:hypothetical protein
VLELDFRAVKFLFFPRRDFSHEIPQKFSRLPLLGAIFLSAPPSPLTWNPRSAPDINFVEYYGIISAIPNNWKQIILDENIKVDKIKAENKPCKYFYKLFIQRIQQEAINCHKKMGKRFRNIYRRLAWYLFNILN